MRKQLNGGAVGRLTGQDIGTGMATGIADTAKKATAAMKATSAKVAAARDLEANAAGKVNVAELKLAEVRAKEGVQGSTVAAAEERLAAAQRAQAAAAGKLAAVSDDLAVAQARVAETSAAAAAGGGRASAAVGRLGSSMGGAAKQALGLGKLIGALALADFAVKSVKAAGDFQQAMTLLVTAGGEAPASLAKVSAGVLAVSSRTGTALSQVSDGMYLVEKAGFRGADGLKVLGIAAEGARAENADLGTVVQALTSEMRSYHVPASQVTESMNALVKGSGEAKTTIQQYAGALSTVLPIASAAHISFADIAGSMATLTGHGTSADEATQEMANTIRNLVAPNHVAVQAMGQLGISATSVAQNIGKRGLSGTLEYLSSTVLKNMGPAGLVLLNSFNQSKVAAAAASTEFASLPTGVQSIARAYKAGSLTVGEWRSAIKALPADQANLARQWKSSEDSAAGFNNQLRSGGPAAVTYTSEIKAMTGGQNGLNTTMQLTGENAKVTAANVKGVAAAAQLGGAHIETWAQTQKGFNVQWSIFTNSIKNAGVQLATGLLPGLTGIASEAIKGATDVGRFAAANKGWLEPVAAGLLAAVVAYKAINLAVRGYEFTLGVAKAAQVALGLATEATTVAQDAENVAIDANPIGAIAGAVGLAVGALLAYSQHNHDAMVSVSDLTTAIEQDNGAIGDQSKALILGDLIKDGTLAKYQKLGLNVQTVTSAYYGNADAQKTVTDKLNGMISANDALTASNDKVLGGTEGAMFGFNKSSTAIINNAATAKGLIGTLDGVGGSEKTALANGKLYEEGLKGTGATTDKTAASTKAATGVNVAWAAQGRKNAQIMGEIGTTAATAATAVKQLPFVLNPAARSLGAVSVSAHQAALDTAAYGAASKTADAGLSQLDTDLSNLGQQYFGIANASDAFRSSLNGIVSALVQSKTGIKGYSDSAISARTAIRTSVGDIGSALAADEKGGMSATKILADYNAQRKLLVGTLENHGLSAAQIKPYTDALAHVPAVIHSQAVLDTTKATALSTVYKDKLARTVPAKVQTKINLVAPNTAETDRLIFQMEKPIPKTIEVQLTLGVDQFNKQLAVLTKAGATRLGASQTLKNQALMLHRATGGPVFGAGSSTSDSIPAMLSTGEDVVNARGYASHRALVDAINSGGPLPSTGAATAGASPVVHVHVRNFFGDQEMTHLIRTEIDRDHLEVAGHLRTHGGR